MSTGVLELLRDGYAALPAGNDPEENLDNAFGGAPIPERRDATRFGFTGKHCLRPGNDFVGMGADELIGALGNRDGALGVIAQGEARYAERGGFFLDAARIGEDQSRAVQQTQKVEITDGRHQAELGDRKSTRLNSSHDQISYAVFCLKNKKE